MKLFSTSDLADFKFLFCANICNYYIPGTELGSGEVIGKNSQRLMDSEKEHPVHPSKITSVSHDLDQRYERGRGRSKEEVLNLTCQVRERLLKR